MADLSSWPFPSSFSLSYCAFVALFRGRLRPAFSARSLASPLSLAACSAMNHAS